MKARSRAADGVFFAALVIAAATPVWSAVTNAISFNDDFGGYTNLSNWGEFLE